MAHREKTKNEAGTQTFHPGQIIELAIVGLDEEGIAYAQADDISFKVQGGLPGELVRAKVKEIHRQRGYAHVVKVLRHSPDRLLSPPCPNCAECDGCSLIRMKYRAQLQWKTDHLRQELTRHFKNADLCILPMLPSPKPLGYRNSAKLVVAGRYADPIIGIYRRNTHEIIDIGTCPLHHPLINRIIEAAKEGIRKGKVPIFSQRTGTGILRYIAVRVSEVREEAMVTLVTAHRSFNEIHHLAKHLQAVVPEIRVILQNVNSSAGNVIFGQKDHFLTREHSLTDAIGAIKFAISPRSFFQINNGGARLIYEQVAELASLTGHETVVDLYCGVGGISFFLASNAKEVIGIESVESAIADAEANGDINDITNCRFIAGDAVHILDDLAKERVKPDVVVMNPPRKGCDAQVLHHVALMKPSKIIYVSCSPRSLAHDLGTLYGTGYAPRTFQPIDMFPQTSHMETVVLLEPRP